MSPSPSQSPTLRHVLVGGAEGFLGHAAISHFARRGLQVTASCRTSADLERVAAFVKKAGFGTVKPVQADLADDQAVARLFDAATQASGPVDAVFNAAGGFRWTPTPDCAPGDFDFLVSANLRTAYLLVRHAVPRMKARGFGRLVFVSARGTLGTGENGLAVYTATKAAINALVQGLAAELKKTGVTVNAVLPTIIDTPANRTAMPGADTEAWVKPEQLLGVVEQLMADGVLNGALVAVAGGL
jgi:NAD(P)-dependent dehydrogenase (short-subunit alcohol dehydrogenase family)